MDYLKRDVTNRLKQTWGRATGFQEGQSAIPKKEKAPDQWDMAPCESKKKPRLFRLTLAGNI
jgi:hypothetical protein